MWFGDLVTMEWWDDLWLKESFADFMGAFSLVEATRFTNGWITFANNRKAWAYRADQLPSTHPITADIRDLEDAKLNFDGITYAKGAVGAEAAGGVRRAGRVPGGRPALLQAARVRQHARSATCCRCWRRPSGRDMAAWSRSWLQTAGVNSLTPQVHVRRGRTGSPSWRCVQEAAESHPELRPHRVAVGLYRRRADGRAGAVRPRRGGRRRARGRSWRSWPGAERPDLVLVNDDDLTYCKIRFDEGSLATLRGHLGDITDPLARALCWSALWNLTRDALMPARDFVDLVLRFAGRESDIGVLQMLHAWAQLGARPLRGARLARAGRPGCWPRARCGSCGCAEPGSQHQLTWARFFAAVATSDGGSPAAAGPAGRARRRSTAWTWTRSCAGRSWSRWPRTGSADEAVARRRTGPRRHGVRQAPPGALPGRAALGGGQGAGVGAGRGVGRAVQRAGRGDDRGLRAGRRSGSCWRRTRSSTSRRSSGCGRSGPSRSAWTWCRGLFPALQDDAGDAGRRRTRGSRPTRTRRRRCGGWCWRRGTTWRGRCGPGVRRGGG